MTLALLGAQATIMFSLGIGLQAADFKRVFQRPFAMSVGLLGQTLLLPLVAFSMAHLLSLPPMFAAGLMLLSFCPGGVTSNIISKLSKSDVALSVSLTATLSILSFLTVPPLVGWSINYFLGEDALTFSFFDLAFVTFLVTTTPVLFGLYVRHNYSKLALSFEPIIEKIAIVLWVIIVSVAIIKSWTLLQTNFAVMGGVLFALPLCMMLAGLLISRLLCLNARESKTIAIEISIQNSPLAIALAATISGQDGFITELALPAAIYSLTMYIIAFPFIFLFRRWGQNSQLIGNAVGQSNV